MWHDPRTRQEAIDKYGEIADWQVSAVTDMSRLFMMEDFNENISQWDTGNVTSMWGMFYGCSSFNQPVEGLNTANVTNMKWMFFGCSSYNQPVEGLNTANVTTMKWMFDNCPSVRAGPPSWYN